MASRFERVSDREIVFTRRLKAPRELVWEAWTALRHLHEWWGPDGFTTTTHEFAFVPGGVWRFTMHAPDGTDNPSHVVFREIDPPRRLILENGWDLPGAPLDFTLVVTLVSVGNETELSLRMTFRDADSFKTALERYGVLEGGIQTLERLARMLRAE